MLQCNWEDAQLNLYLCQVMSSVSGSTAIKAPFDYITRWGTFDSSFGSIPLYDSTQSSPSCTGTDGWCHVGVNHEVNAKQYLTHMPALTVDFTRQRLHSDGLNLKQMKWSCEMQRCECKLCSNVALNFVTLIRNIVHAGLRGSLTDTFRFFSWGRTFLKIFKGAVLMFGKSCCLLLW